MKCGVGIIHNNEADTARLAAVVDDGDSSQSILGGRDNGDVKLWEDELRVGDLVEELGFDSIFAYEHHFTTYAQHPDPLQWLSFWAGRTERIGVGTMLLILTWHHPIRVAEQLIQLQYMLGDRDMTIGLGRGLGLREYSGLGVPMGEARERFVEAIKIVQLALREEAFTYDGQFWQCPDRSQRDGLMSLRPRPRDPQRLLESLYAGWLSPTTYKQLAEMDLRPIIIPNRQYDSYIPELEDFASIRADHGLAPVNACLTNAYAYCAETQDEVEQIRANIRQYGVHSFDATYEMAKNYHAGVPGYEFYGRSPLTYDQTLRSMQALVRTPDQWIAEVQALYDMYEAVPPDQFVFTFNRHSLPIEAVERSMRLFAEEVLPFIHELPVREPRPVPAVS